MAEITINLPFPVSVNRVWRSGRGRVYKSKQYITWIAEANVAWLQQKPHMITKKINGLYKIDIAFSPPDKRRRDLGNLEKGISDFCQSIGLVEDDSFCIDQRLWFCSAKEAPLGARLTIKSVP